MDPITLCLCALALAGSGFTASLGTSRARAAAVVAALFPWLEATLRGWGPSWAGVLAGVVLVSIPAARLRRPSGSWGPPVLLCLLSSVASVVLWSLTVEGSRPWWPLSSQRVAFDWLQAPDPVLWVVLSGALWGQGAVRGKGVAASRAIGVAGVYLGLLGAAHNVAVKRATAWARLEGMDADVVLAFPETPGGLFWNTTAFHDEEALQRPVDTFGRVRAAWRMPRGLEEPLVQDFLALPEGQLWMAGARAPVGLSMVLPEGGYAVFMRDLRGVGRFVNPTRPLPRDVRARFNGAGMLVGVERPDPARPVPFPVPPRPSPESAPPPR